MIRVLLSLIVLLMVFMPGTMPLADTAYPEPAVGNTSEVVEAQVAEAYGKLPLLFIENQGQLDAEVKYYVKAAGQTIYLTNDGIVFDLVRYEETQDMVSADSKAERLVFSLDFLDGNESPVIEGKVKDEAKVNYFIGNDPEKWQTNVPTYREVVYEDVYPDIDLRLYGKQGFLTYDFVVNPGASVTDIALAYTGVGTLAMEAGELVVNTAFGDMRQTKPYIYQEIGDDRVEVRGGFRLATSDTYGFEVASYDLNNPLVIDPALSYSTYLGGTSSDYGYGIAVDSSGCAYVTGRTTSDDFPTHNPYQEASPWGMVAFVTKLNSSGSGLAYSTYLGGSGGEQGYGIAVDSSGCAYVTGTTSSTDFPTTPGAFDTDYNGSADAFVTKLSASGDSLVYSTYLGGSGGEQAFGIAVDSSGCAYVTGRTTSDDFPTHNPYQEASAGGQWPGVDAFVTKLNASGSGLAYSTYLGGSNSGERGEDIAIDSSGCAYVTGIAGSYDFPTENAYQAAFGGGRCDVFVTKLSAVGDSLVYSTFLGGSETDWNYGVAVDSSGCAYVTGSTESDAFPTRNPFQGTYSGGPFSDAFVTKIDTTKSGDASLIYSTYLGGSRSEHGSGIAIDSSGNAYIGGTTGSANLPTKNAYQVAFGGGDDDAFVTKLSATGDSLVYSTYLGGGSLDWGTSMQSR